MKQNDPGAEALAVLIRTVLQQAAMGRDDKRSFMTAYQVLDRLENRKQVLEEFVAGGRGAGTDNTAANYIAHVLANHLGDEVEVAYLDAKGVRFSVADDLLPPGNRVPNLYRLR